MPDQRSVMKEFRFLDQKRLAEGLTADEQARYSELHDLIGPEMGAGGLRGGFDVGAAAARLRESLLPAGLRNRPVVAEAEAEPLEPEPVEEELAAAPAYPAAEPPAREPEREPEPEPPFDPAILAALPAEGEAAGFDAAAAGYDPNQPYDPNVAQAYDPAAAGYDPNQPYDPNAAQAYDPAAAGYDPNQPYDPNAQAHDPGAAPEEGLAEAAPVEGSLADWSSAEPAPPEDHAAMAEGQPAAPSAAGPLPDGAVADLDPAAYAVPAEGPADAAAAWDAQGAGPALEIEAGTALPPDGSGLPPEGWDATPPFPGAPIEPSFGEYDEAGAPALGLSSPDDLAAHLEGTPPPSGPAAPPALGAYDDMLAFEPAAESADLPVEGAAPGADWQPDTALDQGFQLESGGSFVASAEAAAPEWAGLSAEPPWTGAPVAPEPAGAPPSLGLEDELDASFAEPAAAPPPSAVAGVEDPGPEGLDFAEPLPAAPEAPPLDGAADAALEAFAEPELDLAAAPEPASPAASLEGAGPEEPPADWAPPIAAAEPLPEADAEADEIPTIEGEEILEEIPPEEGVAPPASLDFGPLPGAPLAEPEPLEAAPLPAHAPPAYEPPPFEPPPHEPLSEAAAAPPEEAAEAIAPPPPLAEEAAAEPFPAPIEPPPAPAEPAPGTAPLAGAHRVVVHTVEGQVKRGLLEDPDLGAAELALLPQPGGAAETIATDKVKVIFFMLQPGEKAAPPEGKKVRVTFRDGRQVAGFSPDYQEGGVGFFMIPADTRTNTGRIWVYQASVRQVAVS